MSSNLYKEALFEVDELKRMAEENAKNKIIEAVTPKIRHMIEAQLLGEKKIDDLDDFDDDSLEDEEDTELAIGSNDFELDMSSDLIDSSPEPAISQVIDSLPPTITDPAPEAAPRIKIDVQGSEFDILRPIITFPENLQWIIVENNILNRYNNFSNFSTVTSQLNSKGFRFLNLMQPSSFGVPAAYDALYISSENPLFKQ